jgi:hypothetical protein
MGAYIKQLLKHFPSSITLRIQWCNLSQNGTHSEYLILMKKAYHKKFIASTKKL